MTLWIVTILALLAVGAGFRMGLEIKLTGFNVSELKALYLAKAGINKAVAARWISYSEGKTRGIDAYAQGWANDEEGFRDFELGGGRFTLSFLPKELDRSDKEITLYGMQDESSRIDINDKKAVKTLTIFLMNRGLELEEAGAIAESIADWRDSDNIPAANGAEESYYQALEKPYHASDRNFRAVDELLLVKGVTEELFHEIKDYLTVFGEGKININTAPEPVLDAVFAVGYSDLAAKIVEFRKGFDGKAGTTDDRWFARGDYTIERKGFGLKEIKNLNDKSWSGNIFGVTSREWARLKELAGKETLITTSDIYRVNAVGEAGKVKKKVTAVIRFNKPKPLASVGFSNKGPAPDIEYLWWREE